MNQLVAYFSDVPDSHRIILLGLSLFIFGNLELLFSFKKGENRFKHIRNNVLFMLPAAPIQFLFGLLIVYTIHYCDLNKVGILHHLPFQTHAWISFVIGFFALDFLEYIYHIIMHKVKRLWMFHLVHHSDRDLTVSTTLREHPIETSFRLAFLVLWIFITGISFWALLFRQFIQIFSNVFVHANFRLNETIDRWLSILFVTPNMHQVHHHFEQPYTDKNYGDVLSIWDRMFGTYTTMKADEIVFGVDTYFDKTENQNFKTLLQIPFGQYRKSSKKI